MKPLAIAAILFAACTAQSAGIPCTTSDNCPSGLFCIGGTCAPRGNGDDAGRDTIRAADVGRPDRVDAGGADVFARPDVEALDQARPDVERPDVERPDTMPRPDHAPPDAYWITYDEGIALCGCGACCILGIQDEVCESCSACLANGGRCVP